MVFVLCKGYCLTITTIGIFPPGTWDGRLIKKRMMDTLVQHYLVPEHLAGIQKDLSYAVTLESGEDADDWFVEAMDRLLKINDWNKRVTDIGYLFNLTDHHGKNVNRRAHMGDYIKIHTRNSLAGPENEICWMKIEAIEYDDYPDVDKESIAIHLMPSVAPGHHVQTTGFDMTEVSSTFVIERWGKRLSASYHSRNELTETEGEGQQEILTAIVSWYSVTDKEWESLLQGFTE